MRNLDSFVNFAGKVQYNTLLGMKIQEVMKLQRKDVHLIVRNTKSWSNSELRKKCKIQEYGGYTGTDEGGTSGGTSGGTEQGGGTQEGGGSQEGGDGLE